MIGPADEVAQWLASARGGSTEALGQALEHCRVYLLLVAQRELAPALQAKGGASDLVQETFLEAQRDFKQFQGTTAEELLAWLRRLLLHNLADFARRYRDTGKRGVGREVPLPADATLQGPGKQRTAPSPSDEAIAREQVEAFHHALGRLPADYREVILLRYQGRMTFEQIGATTDRTANAARMLWLRAVGRLKHELGMT